MGYKKSSPIEILGEFPGKPKVRFSSTGLTNTSDHNKKKKGRNNERKERRMRKEKD